MIRHSIVRQVLAMRAAAATLLEQSDALLALLEEDGMPTEKIVEPKSNVCEHPAEFRVARPIDGYPLNFFCGKCEREVSV